MIIFFISREEKPGAFSSLGVRVVARQAPESLVR